MKKHFYFPFYPDKFITGTLGFTTEEKGAYVMLLCYQFDNGSIPENEEELSLITGTNIDLNKVLKKFPNNINQKMKKVCKDLALKSEKASTSASVRWQCERNTNAMLSKAKVKEKEKDRDREKDIRIASLVLDKPKLLSPQAQFIEKWGSLYKQETGFDYKAVQKDFVLIANMLKKYTEEQMLTKSKILYKFCKNQSHGFAKGMGDFNIGNLSHSWNQLVETEAIDKVQNDISNITKEMKECNVNS